MVRFILVTKVKPKTFTIDFQINLNENDVLGVGNRLKGSAWVWRGPHGYTIQQKL